MVWYFISCTTEKRSLHSKRLFFCLLTKVLNIESVSLDPYPPPPESDKTRFFESRTLFRDSQTSEKPSSLTLDRYISLCLSEYYSLGVPRRRQSCRPPPPPLVATRVTDATTKSQRVASQHGPARTLPQPLLLSGDLSRPHLGAEKLVKRYDRWEVVCMDYLVV